VPQAVLEAGCADAEVSDVQLAPCLLWSINEILEERTLMYVERHSSTKGMKNSS
jgi:hypothetical protein